MPESTPNRPLIKTCSSCGLQKPLSAFLQLSDKGGLTYGNVCASCRHANKDKKQQDVPPDDGIISQGIGLKIDAKEKVQADLERQLLHTEREVLDKLAREKNEFKKEKRKNLIKQKAGQERKHREGFLQRRPTASKPPAAATSGKQAEVAKTSRAAAAKQQFVNKEHKKTLINYEHSTEHAMLLSGQVKYTSAEYRKLRAWLGKGLGAPVFATNAKTLGLVKTDKGPTSSTKFSSTNTPSTKSSNTSAPSAKSSNTKTPSAKSTQTTYTPSRKPTRIM